MLRPNHWTSRNSPLVLQLLPSAVLTFLTCGLLSAHCHSVPSNLYQYMLTYVLYPQLHKVDFCNDVNFMDKGTEEQRCDLTLVTNLGHSGAWI